MEAHELLETTYKENASTLIAALMSVVRDLDFAEDLLQEAMVSALEHWPQNPPHSPAGWLLTTARRKAIDTIRRQKVSEKNRVILIIFQEQIEKEKNPDLIGGFGDERLRLLFTCCHPALSQEAQIALTLKTVCGLSTQEISSAFLVSDVTLSQRLVRAKTKIKKAKIPYIIPPIEILPDRINNVLAVIYLVFNEGYHSKNTHLLNVNLCQEAIRLCDTLILLVDMQFDAPLPEVLALASLMKINHARIRSRVSDLGELVTLEEQNRSLWNHNIINVEAQKIDEFLKQGPLGPYQIQAAIAALHALSPNSNTTDWIQIVGLYNELFALSPTPVVRLNRAVALAMAFQPEDGLREMEFLEKEQSLKNYSLLPAAQADLFRRLGNHKNAALHYEKAIILAKGHSEIKYYQRRLAQLNV